MFFTEVVARTKKNKAPKRVVSPVKLRTLVGLTKKEEARWIRTKKKSPVSVGEIVRFIFLFAIL